LGLSKNVMDQIITTLMLEVEGRSVTTGGLETEMGSETRVVSSSVGKGILRVLWAWYGTRALLPWSVLYG
jgi:hypothetical protein